MKEIKDIVNAFNAAQKLQTKTALATVVHVDGSSYRRAGARMLITEDGQLTGAISGGCLEGDALRKARLVIMQQKPMLVTYDTTDDDDAKLGVQLGCNGVISILIEPVDPSLENNPVSFLQKYLSAREPVVLVTVFDMENRQSPQYGTCLLMDANGQTQGYLPQEVGVTVMKDALELLQTNGAASEVYSNHNNYTCFVELLLPPISLIVAGAGNDALPLVAFAKILGWKVTLIDGRPNYNTPDRFPDANRIVAKAEEALTNVLPDNRTAFMLMTHNYNYDIALLQQLLPLSLPYIGVLGPKKRLNKMLDEIAATSPSDYSIENIHGPAGLDLGAENAEQIALSIVSEIQAVFSKLTGQPLKNKAVIHDRETEHVIEK
ncbi:XdhC family protein [Mucilaginibacter pallidiroseus]|uniref:XdhC family protein n=1 Tax=Mucilaginibacter pallidiroseus TaxID=2599295 RepID=A0A563U850_9SPHI|nr:XdhC/CoxI family protein [Mucilaginibacter pallidiroseus]TWR27520.1 XdhC family protein [Mucilaginibacter pallidiroseus]